MQPAGVQAGSTARDLHTAHVDGREAVHVLLGRDGVDDSLLVNLGGQRQLHQNAVHSGVIRQLLHLGQQGVLRGVGGQVDAAALDAALRTVADLAADVDLAGGVLAHQNDRQAGLMPLLFSSLTFLRPRPSWRRPMPCRQ